MQITVQIAFFFFFCESKKENDDENVSIVKEMSVNTPRDEG